MGQGRGRREPGRAVRLLALNAAGGSAFGLAVVAALLFFDFAGLTRLMAMSGDAPSALLLLAGGFAATFAAVVAATAIMLIPQTGQEGRHGGGEGCSDGRGGNCSGRRPVLARARR